MASGHLSRLRCLISRFPNNSKLRHAQTCLVPVVHKSSSSSSGPSPDASSWKSLPIIKGEIEMKRSNVEIGVTSDGKTIVCYHPSGEIPYELTQPIERPDPLSAPPETQDQVLKAHLSRGVLRDKQGPTIEELSKMFFTTKHRWYPVGQYHMRRRKKDPPKDR